MPDRSLIYLCAVIAMTLIFILEVIALSHGINGIVLKLSLSLIAGIAGYVVRDLRIKKKRKFFS